MEFNAWKCLNGIRLSLGTTYGDDMVFETRQGETENETVERAIKALDGKIRDLSVELRDKLKGMTE